MSTSTTCANASRSLAEPMSGTAATARAWLLVEQPGPWGAKALTSSHLDPEAGGALDALAAEHRVRVALIRRPGRHADSRGGLRRRVFLAHTAPGSSWIRTTELGDDLTPLLGLDFAAISAGEHGGLWEAYDSEPLALVCTNGKRDRCCALRGRPLAAELAMAGGAGVWEITHIGGHRFAPTLLVLPYGYAYGRATAHSVKAVLDAVREGHMSPEGCRGRSTWDRPGQVADLAVRRHTGITRADTLTVLRSAQGPPGDGCESWTVTVGHPDGRTWGVTVRAVDEGMPIPASCGAALGVPPAMRVEGIEGAAEQVTALDTG